MSAKTSHNSALNIAKELTQLAMEHHYITADADPVKSAKNVTDFFNAIYDTLKVSSE